MQVVAYLAPALAPLAIKLIDRYVFDDERAAVPQIIQIPAVPQCACCCGHLPNGEDSSDITCSTCCTSKSSASRRVDKKRLSTKSTGRCSSTSDAYGRAASEPSATPKSNECDVTVPSYPRLYKEKLKSPSTSSTRRLSDSMMNSINNPDKQTIDDGHTLAVLAGHLQQEIVDRQSRKNTISSHRSSKSRSIKESSGKLKAAKDIGSSSGSRSKSHCNTSMNATKGSSRKFNLDSDGSKALNH